MIVREVYTKLLNHYGKPEWWSDNPYKVMVEAVLVQNAAWRNVLSIRVLLGDKLTPEYIEQITLDELMELIRPCGFYNAKANCIKALTAWYKRYDYSARKVKGFPQEQIRKELLAIRGIGAETADVILVYSFYMPSFIVDTYTKRLLERLGVPVKLETENIKAAFEKNIDGQAELYGRYHWLILQHGIDFCRKKPICKGCPLISICQWPGRI